MPGQNGDREKATGDEDQSAHLGANKNSYNIAKTSRETVLMMGLHGSF